MKKIVVRKDAYVDSVFLMRISKELQNSPGVTAATVTMATPMNIALLRDQDFSGRELDEAQPNDLVIALDCSAEQDLEAAMAVVQQLLAGKGTQGGLSVLEETCHSLDEAKKIQRDANIAIISVPGIYAAREAKKALQHDMHVMLFSDNVTLEEEIALKKTGSEKGLLVMGPDCGTAIIGGKPLCFANVVSSGNVGIVAASGTGLQEVSCLLDQYGCGVSQAIGTGGRDLKNEQVGGTTMLMGIRALAADDKTQVIVVISKPPAQEVMDVVLSALERAGKPSVVHFIGAKAAVDSQQIHWAQSLQECARIAASLAGCTVRQSESWPFDARADEIDALVAQETLAMNAEQRYVRGYYTGGTLADEAWIALHRLTGSVYSNNQTDAAFLLQDPHVSVQDTIVDLGDDVFTVGRPHPMIDPSVRTQRIDAERDDPSIAVMLIDCVIGYGSHEDPAGAMVPSLVGAKQAAQERKGYLSIIASVTGTDRDYQQREKQVAELERIGVIVMPSNYQAVMLAARILAKRRAIAMPKETEARVHTYVQKDIRLPVYPVERIHELFEQGPIAINIGLKTFAENLRACNAPVIHVDWRPPAHGDPQLIAALDRLSLHAQKVDAANREAVQRVRTGKPMLVGIAQARDVVPGMRDRLILHAGPPVQWEHMCGPMRGAVIGAILYEGWAKNEEEATLLASSDEIEYSPCHHHQAVGPMAGIMTASMPVWIVKNETFGNTAYATLNEGLGKVLRYGAYGDEVIERLHWMEKELAPVLAKALERHGPLDMRSLIAQALQMGDEGHNRNRAGTSLVIRELAPHLVMLDEKRAVISRVLSFMNTNDHFFLNLTMPSAKCVMDAASGIANSTMITAMARNGTQFGIRVSGLPDRWFTGPASMVDGLYLPGFSASDAAPDIGDSVITETYGIGGFAMAAAPAIVQFVGGTPSDAITYTKRMYEITLSESEVYRIPILDFRGTPTGIDVRLVVEKGIVPVINTGIAHKEAGIGMVGAGLVKPPVNCFEDALKACADAYAVDR